jgi:hypothetical protein
MDFRLKSAAKKPSYQLLFARPTVAVLCACVMLHSRVTCSHSLTSELVCALIQQSLIEHLHIDPAQWWRSLLISCLNVCIISMRGLLKLCLLNTMYFMEIVPFHPFCPFLL